jgi:2-dehydropantoate 2-reductase
VARRPPRICVFGAGSVGCLLGGLLSRDVPVVLIGRQRLADEIATHGLHLTSWRGEQVKLAPGAVRYVTDARTAATSDLVLVTVKCADTEKAARLLAPLLPEAATVISFQNGLRNAELLRQTLPRQIVLAGMVPFNVIHRGEGCFHRASAGELMVECAPAITSFAPIFARAGLPLVARSGMPAVQWAKLLLNLNNPINALSDLPLREELARRDYRRCLALAQREALRALDAAGITPARLTPLPASWIPPLLEMPDALFRALAAGMLAIDPLARSSMWEDLQARRATEIDFINGEVTHLAQSIRLTAPVNERLITLIRAAEAGDRRRWGAAELLAALKGAALSRT